MILGDEQMAVNVHGDACLAVGVVGVHVVLAFGLLSVSLLSEEVLWLPGSSDESSPWGAKQ